MTQGERVRAVRNALELTMEKFGEELGVTKVAISNIEKGNRGLTDQMAKAICRAYSVDEKWLRTGEGEMFATLTRDEEIADFVAGLLKTEDDSFQRRFVAMLSRLDESEWEVLAKMAKILAQDETEKS